MTRSDAEQLIEDCGGKREALAALSTHWIGHGQDGCDAGEIEEILYEYIDENALADRDVGPQPSDECDLTDPDAPPYTASELARLTDVAHRGGMNAEQLDCLRDRARSTEALGMLDDLQARIGVAGDILAPARAILRDITAPEDPVAILSDLLRAWQSLQGLPAECADQQRAMRHDLSDTQREWLRTYSLLWEKTV